MIYERYYEGNRFRELPLGIPMGTGGLLHACDGILGSMRSSKQSPCVVGSIMIRKADLGWDSTGRFEIMLCPD
jgi:hypothetical protein